MSPTTPPPQRKQYRLAITFVGKQGIKDQIEGLPGFVRLAIGQAQNVHFFVVVRDCRLQARRIKGGDGDVGDDQGSRCTG